MAPWLLHAAGPHFAGHGLNGDLDPEAVRVEVLGTIAGSGHGRTPRLPARAGDGRATGTTPPQPMRALSPPVR
jgi:hypothetical protein